MRRFDGHNRSRRILSRPVIFDAKTVQLFGTTVAAAEFV
jgi:hypothetical protein